MDSMTDYLCTEQFTDMKSNHSTDKQVNKELFLSEAVASCYGMELHQGGAGRG